ncbi:hypothetical protein [Pantoea sp. FN0307]|uniref:hypothetical protein n=1 Tax=Pantoea sp. FN0307 TaxID=3418560 RepID=UPI003CF555CF
MLAPSSSLITLPLSMVSHGGCHVSSVSVHEQDWQKKGFITRVLNGMVAAAVSMAATMFHSILLLCLKLFFLGIYQALAQFYRFAVGEAALPASRAKAISLVLAGGVVASAAGAITRP